MLHFERSEFDARIAKARVAMQREGLDALLLFAQESTYYLTGYDTTGFVFFQCAVMTANDEPITLLTRRPDLEQARRTSTVEDIRLWYDAPGMDPSRELLEILEEKGLKGMRVGIEMRTFGLTANNYELVRQRLEGWCTLVDASNLVRSLRVIKSPAEIVYVRRSAELADQSLLAMLDASGPGVFEGKIAAAGSLPVFEGGGDPPPSGPVLGSGDRALLVRSATGFRHLDPVDQLTMEFAASFRHYCVCLMRTIAIGRANPQQERMFGVTLDSIHAMTDAARVGNTIGAIDDAHRAVFDHGGFGHARMSACGYSLGATYRPSWMDVPPMIYSGNLAMSIGYTILTTDGGPEVLTSVKPEFITKS
jgi:Xaa-Pro dipeptidase